MFFRPGLWGGLCGSALHVHCSRRPLPEIHIHQLWAWPDEWVEKNRPTNIPNESDRERDRERERERERRERERERERERVRQREGVKDRGKDRGRQEGRQGGKEASKTADRPQRLAPHSQLPFSATLWVRPGCSSGVTLVIRCGPTPEEVGSQPKSQTFQVTPRQSGGDARL